MAKFKNIRRRNFYNSMEGRNGPVRPTSPIDWKTARCACGTPIYPKWQTCYPCRKKVLGTLAS